ncbi:MAG: hypothetical protein Q9165_007273 [Trypethelium subeluteriae]
MKSSSPVFLSSAAQPQGGSEPKEPPVSGIGAAIISLFGGRNDPTGNIVIDPGSRVPTVLSANPNIQPVTTIPLETSGLGIGAAIVSALDGEGAFQDSSGHEVAENKATKEISSAANDGGQAVSNIQPVSPADNSGDNRASYAIGEETYDTNDGISTSFMAYNGPGIAPFASGLPVIMNGQTLSANGPAITISSQAVGLEDSGVALGSMTVEYQPPATLAPTVQGAVITLGPSLITAINSAETVMINSLTHSQ